MRRMFIRTVGATLQCVSGLRIGGSQDDLQIGGTDLPVIKHPVTQRPYIPGSSLKGKMRAELEKEHDKHGVNDASKPCDCAQPQCPICLIFGAHTNRSTLGPSRLIVRDAPVTGSYDIEIKAENIIDRAKGSARDLRQLERVAAEATFNLELRVQVFDVDEAFSYKDQRGEKALLAVVREGLLLVQETGLGGGISRGCGHVRIKDLKLDGKDWQ